ncbi:MAG: D-alanyl-D-alanine carboxypeptidase/D-alanyl-D-alanine-endopeptidase [Pyrinomonadaceae bacterium]
MFASSEMIDPSRLKRSALIFLIGLALVLAVALPEIRKSINAQQDTRAASSSIEQSGDESRNAFAPSQASAPGSASRAARQLQEEIDRVIDESEFASARWGVYASSLRDGRTLYARNAGELFTPASNMKVYTTAVALDLLGANYRWRTSVYAAAPPDAGGAIAGDITLYGRGAPDLVSRSKKNKEASPSLASLADALYERGVRRVRGNVVGDESYFRGEPLGDGWLWTDVQWYFGAEVSALSIDDNALTLQITPAARFDEPATITSDDAAQRYVRVTNDANTVARGARSSVGVTRGLSDNEIRVWGEFPAGTAPLRVRLAMHNPALIAAQLFRDALLARGIKVEGEALARDARGRSDLRFDPQGATELASALSGTLGEIARATNKESINLNAELILRTLGKERDAPFENQSTKTSAAESSKKRLRGSDEAGLATVRTWLERAGIATKQLALHDGCGLSRLDLVTPEATARLLAAMTRSSAATVFRDSLPIAGRDGTLQSRLRVAQNRIEAKTGTLTYIHTLSGYATTADGEPIVFAIFCNDETAKASSTPIIDAIAARLAAYHRN